MLTNNEFKRYKKLFECFEKRDGGKENLCFLIGLLVHVLYNNIIASIAYVVILYNSQCLL